MLTGGYRDGKEKSSETQDKNALSSEAQKDDNKEIHAVIYSFHSRDLGLSTTGDVEAKLRFSAMQHVPEGKRPKINVCTDREIFIANANEDTFTFARYIDGSASLSRKIPYWRLQDIDFAISCGAPLVEKGKAVKYTHYERPKVLYKYYSHATSSDSSPMIVLGIKDAPSEVYVMYATGAFSRAQEVMESLRVDTAVLLAYGDVFFADEYDIRATDNPPQIMLYTDTYTDVEIRHRYKQVVS